MKYLILSASSPQNKAGVVALDLYKGLKSGNNDVVLLVKEHTSIKDFNIVSMENRVDWFFRVMNRKFSNLFQVLGILKKKFLSDHKYSFLNFDQTNSFYETKDILRRINFIPDVIVVCFMQNFISFKNLHELYKLTGAKINLYLMDMGPMTGGCHYSWNCENYKVNCGKCPAIFSLVEKDKSYENLEYKKKFIKNMNVKVVTASNWTLAQVKNSALFKNCVSTNIFLSVDKNIFKSVKDNSRSIRLNLEPDTKIVFFGATTVSNERKGFDHVIKSLTHLRNNHTELKVHLLIAGFLEENVSNQLPYNYTQLGLLDLAKLAEAFGMSDVFLSPSLQDAGPMMINQSIACGTPVVSYKMGVALDLVVDGKTGYLADLYNYEKLSHCIYQLISLSDSELREMRINCVDFSNKNLTYECQSKAFIELNA